MEQIKSFIAENRLALFIGILLLILICWLHADNHRNDGIHQDTDSTVADIDKRIQSIEGRLDSAIKRSERIEDLIREIEKANR